MHSRHKDGFTTDPVHVDTGTSFQVIEMDVSKLGDEVDNIILGADLQMVTYVQVEHTFLPRI